MCGLIYFSYWRHSSSFDVREVNYYDITRIKRPRRTSRLIYMLHQSDVIWRVCDAGVRCTVLGSVCTLLGSLSSAARVKRTPRWEPAWSRTSYLSSPTLSTQQSSLQVSQHFDATVFTPGTVALFCFHRCFLYKLIYIRYEPLTVFRLTCLSD